METNKFVILAFLVVTQAAWAAPAPAPVTVGDIGELQAETILIQAKTRREEASLELQSARKSGATDDAEIELPELKSIMAISSRAVVRLVYSSGVKMDASVGDVVPGGYKLTAIDESAQQIKLIKGKKTFLIGMGMGGAAKASVNQGSLKSAPGVVPSLTSSRQSSFPVAGSSTNTFNQVRR